MDRNKLLYATNVLMGFFFITSFVTGLLKFTLLLRLSGLNRLLLPSALISDIHDLSGIMLGLLVLFHLYMNRRWIIAMTRKIVHGSKTDT
jgi:cytochrome b subunit of formate dehydrogenase